MSPDQIHTPELEFVGRISDGRVRLPLLKIEAVDRPCEQRQRSRITEPGYRKGLKPGNHGKRFPATPPTAAEVLRILDQCDLGTKRGVRNRALVATLWRTGLRISEALALIPYQVDFEQHTVTVLRGKGSKRRVVGIDNGALLEISRWMFVRSGLPIDHAACPLFCTVNAPNPGRPLYSAYVREWLRETRVRAGVPHRVAPHQLRHAHAVELARERTPMHIVQRQLGHSNLGTTATYLAGIAPQEVVDHVSKREWPS